jgi:AcrR family transcriptional regulator
VPDTVVEADTVVELGRRERKKLETRRGLREAALHLVAERGPDQVSVEDIAEAADVSVRTFFNYFSSKEEALFGWDEEALEAITASVVARPANEPPFKALRAVIRGYFDGVEAWADQRALRHQLVRQHPSLLPRFLATHHQMDEALLRGLVTRLGEDSLFARLVVTTSSNAMRLTLTHWEAEGRKVPVTDLLDQAFDALERGLKK